MQVFFEVFSVPAYYASMVAKLPLYCSGRVTGLVLDSGDGVTQAVPVFQGQSLPHAIVKVDFAGRDLSHLLKEMVPKHAVSLSPNAPEIFREIKEKECYVAFDFEQEMQVYNEGD